jgi:acetyl-CoA C-acetyltransferase
MNKVYIVSAKRTAIGSFLGALKNVSASDLAAPVIQSILEETKINPSHLDEVLLGNILPAGQGQGVARQASIKAGVPSSVPAYGVNMVCGSGMKAIMLSYANIVSGFANLVIAGGTESMSQTPFLLPREIRDGVKMGSLTASDHMLQDALMDAFDNIHMGVTAENIVEKYGITRQEQDEFAIASQKKAISALDRGVFKDEIVPILVKTRKESLIVDTDEYPNRKTTLEKLQTLRPAFKKDGSVTAGNSSGINDGASVMLIASQQAVDNYNLEPLVEIVGFGQGGVDSRIMGLGPTPAIKQALSRSGLTIDDIDLFELNEAFAAQSLGVLIELEQEFNVKKEDILAKTNVNGGAIALGHPVGASGNRITTTLIHQLIRENKTYGLASLCIGGGMGTAIIVKNCKQ